MDATGCDVASAEGGNRTVIASPLAQQRRPHDASAYSSKGSSGLFGRLIISVGVAVCWTFSAKVSFDYNQLDEGDKYEIGSDAAGTVASLSLLSLSLLWLALCAMIIASRAVGHMQPLFTAEMLWQVKAFAAAQSLGLLLLVTSGCWLPRRATDE